MSRIAIYTAMALSAILAMRSSPTGTTTPPAAMVAGSEACSFCHQEIYQSYEKTVMARASGAAGDGLITGEFDDKTSGVRYRVYTQEGRVWMSYERAGGLKGQKELLFFVGSGKKGRTYLFSDEGYLFEAPINWYSQERRWNMTPAYIDAPEIPMNLPSYSSCLNCHTSGLQPRVPGTRNKFAGKPFLHSGITCERCHGEGEAHLADGKGSIVNPAKLTAERRDSVCMECHFEGTVAVTQPGRRVYQFRPGDTLSDYVHYFVLIKTQTEESKALSQFEALSMSLCKEKSGEKMWCGSCHDPHMEPSEAEKVTYYRGKCLNCHGRAFGEKHHPDKPDCRQCHMPDLPSRDVAHTQSTDHRILRNPRAPQLTTRMANLSLKIFPVDQAARVTTRDLALAWFELAQRGVEGAEHKAEEYLSKALQESPNDPQLLSSLGFMEQKRGHEKEARELYEKSLQLRPRSNTVATNLGVLEAKRGDLRDAVMLWQRAFARVPYRSVIGMDLAMAFCAAGQREQARQYVQRVLEFNPDDGQARKMMANLDGKSGRCGP